MYPDRETARSALKEAEFRNPGPWISHSQNVALAAEKIAAACGMNPEKAYTLGLLHDIGRRTGISQLRHTVDGYDYAMAQGWDEVGRVCLTHSFPVKDIDADIGKKDVTPEQYAFLDRYLKTVEYDDYDKLLIVCDAMADAKGFCILEKRFVDTARRYGLFPFTLERWNKTFEFKSGLEEKARQSLEEILNI